MSACGVRHGFDLHACGARASFRAFDRLDVCASCVLLFSHVPRERIVALPARLDSRLAPPMPEDDRGPPIVAGE